MKSRENQRQTQPGRGRSAGSASGSKRSDSARTSSYKEKSESFDKPARGRGFAKQSDSEFPKKRSYGDKPERSPRSKDDSYKSSGRFERGERKDFGNPERGRGFSKPSDGEFPKKRSYGNKPEHSPRGKDDSYKSSSRFERGERKDFRNNERSRGFSKPVDGEAPKRRSYDEMSFRSASRNNESYVETRFNKDVKMRSRKSAESKDYNPNDKYSQKKQLAHHKKNTDPDAPVRLNRFLANSGLCSRREADEYIAAGVVTVNGEVVTEMGARVIPSTDRVLFHDQLVRSEKKVYVLLNKPKDCVTTTDDPGARLTVMDLVKNACSERIYPVGRLDRNTTGVLLLTNDGDMAAKLTHPKYNKKKIYHVFLNKAVTKADMERIAAGITLEDGEIHADSIEYIDDADKKQVGIEIHSGRNRIVRRIFEHLGYNVVRLDRVYFAGLTKKKLARGKWRLLTEKEINMLRMGAYE
jgi:23S rRNA pseudouridine2605 synthase